ncbi:MAG: preprotein translocase subunit SecG, partial [Planctomycetia bacterium]|nr:preprotein translocase subunit SecG [Planctomycetia bacterium]
VWIVLSMICVVLYNQRGQSAWGNDTNTSVSKEVAPKNPKKSGTVPATGSPTTATGSPDTTGPVGVPAIPETPSPATKK